MSVEVILIWGPAENVRLLIFCIDLDCKPFVLNFPELDYGIWGFEVNLIIFYPALLNDTLWRHYQNLDIMHCNTQDFPHTLMQKWLLQDISIEKLRTWIYGWRHSKQLCRVLFSMTVINVQTLAPIIVIYG